MALTTVQKDKIYRFLMRRWSRLFESCGWADKQTLRNAIDDSDAWIDAVPDGAALTNQASFNSALNSLFRSTATVEQKSLVLMAVIGVRAGLTPEELGL